MERNQMFPHPMAPHDGRPGVVSRAIDELIFWLVAMAFSPWILRDRLRRRRQRRSDRGPATDRALQSALDRLSTAHHPNHTGPGRRPLSPAID